MYTVTEIYSTCSACPSQWEGKTDLKQDVYVRYRWGVLRVDIAGETVFLKECGVPVTEETLPESCFLPADMQEKMRASLKMMLATKNYSYLSFDGSMSFDELKEHTKDIIDWRCKG